MQNRPVNLVLQLRDSWPKNMQKMQVNIVSKISGKVAHKINFSARLNGDIVQETVNYFNALAIGKTTNSGNESKEERIARLASTFEELVLKSIHENNISWEKETGLTVLGSLQRVYNESKAAKLINDSAQVDFDIVAAAIGRQKSEIRAGGFLKSAKKNRANFVKELKKISPNYRD